MINKKVDKIPKKTKKVIIKQNNYDTINIESAVNFIHADLVRVKSYKNQKPEEWQVVVDNNKYIDSVSFIPTYFITPIEAIIQRVIMGRVRNLIYNFDGTPEEFKDKTFEITLSQIQNELPKPRLEREIRSAMNKLIFFQIKINTHTGNEMARKILENGNLNKNSLTFKANPIFQIMRKEAHREIEQYNAISVNNEGKTQYKKIYINLDDVLKLNSPIQQIILYHFIKRFEISNLGLPTKIYYIDNDFVQKVFNKNFNKNDTAKFRKAVDEIIDMKEFENLFTWSGRGKKALIVRFYDK
jgi:hypothetical protein